MQIVAGSAKGLLAPVGHPHKRVRASDRVYAELANAIRELRLAPGQAISETDLTAAMRVSRTPVREALGRLVESGLVSVIPQVGTKVSQISICEVREAQFVRENLEVAAFVDAGRHSALDLTPLRTSISAGRAANETADLAAFFDADEAFHAALFEIGGHSLAWAAINSMNVQLDRIRRLSSPSPATLASMLADHLAIVEALETSAIAEGVALIAEHSKRVLDTIPALASQHPDWVID